MFALKLKLPVVVIVCCANCTIAVDNLRLSTATQLLFPSHTKSTRPDGWDINKGIDNDELLFIVFDPAATILIAAEVEAV
jgi:hypothetical protein